MEARTHQPQSETEVAPAPNARDFDASNARTASQVLGALRAKTSSDQGQMSFGTWKPGWVPAPEGAAQ